MKIQCRNCGYIINGDNKFCPECGARITRQSSLEDNTVVINEERTKKKSVPALLISAAFLCLLAVMIFILGTGKIGGGAKENALYFTNKLSSDVHNIYISPTDTDTWGDPLTNGIIKKGRTATIDFDKIVNGEGTYDVGTIDENYMNYDLYGVDIHLRDTIILEGSADGATFKIRHDNGTTDTYEANIYKSE